MTRLVQRSPNLLVTNKGPEELRDSLHQILKLAKFELDRAREENRGGLDTTTSRRVRSPTQKQQGRGNIDEKRVDRALNTDSERDWGKAIEDLI
jgi:hypothetical protein